MNSRILFVPVVIVRSLGALVNKIGDLLVRTKATTISWLQTVSQLESSSTTSAIETSRLATAPSYIHTGTRFLLMVLSDIPKDIANLTERQKIPAINSVPVQGPVIALNINEEGEEEQEEKDSACKSGMYYFFKVTAITAVSFDTVSTYFTTLQFITLANSATAYFAPELSPIGSPVSYLFAVANAGLYFYMCYSKLTTIPEGLVSVTEIIDPKAPCLNNFRIVGDAIATASIAYGSSCMIGNRLFPKNSLIGVSMEDAPRTLQESFQITAGIVGAVSKGLYRLVDTGKALKKNMAGELEPSKSSYAQVHYFIASGLAIVDAFFTGLNGANGMIRFANDIRFPCALTDLTSNGTIPQKAYVVLALTVNISIGAPAVFSKHKSYIKIAYQKVIKQPGWETPQQLPTQSSPLPSSPLISTRGHDYGTFGALQCGDNGDEEREFSLLSPIGEHKKVAFPEPLRTSPIPIAQQLPRCYPPITASSLLTESHSLDDNNNKLKPRLFSSLPTYLGSCVLPEQLPAQSSQLLMPLTSSPLMLKRVSQEALQCQYNSDEKPEPSLLASLPKVLPIREDNKAITSVVDFPGSLCTSPIPIAQQPQQRPARSQKKMASSFPIRSHSLDNKLFKKRLSSSLPTDFDSCVLPEKNTEEASMTSGEQGTKKDERRKAVSQS